MAKNNETFRTIRIVSIIAGLVFVLCGTVWAVGVRFSGHENRITILETRFEYIKEALERIEDKVNE